MEIICDNCGFTIKCAPCCDYICPHCGNEIEPDIKNICKILNKVFLEDNKKIHQRGGENHGRQSNL